MTESTIINLISKKLECTDYKSGFGAFGDDGFVTPQASANEQLVTSTDSFVEGVHFNPDMGFFSVGWKSLVTALSDVFAMGAAPSFYSLNLILPKKLPLENLEAFLDGLSEATKAYNVKLMGGDVSRGSSFCIVIQASGYQDKNFIKPNFSASKGDVVLTDGPLGHAYLGFQQFMKKNRETPFVDSFLFPRPNLFLGPWLGRKQAVTSLTDVSDGFLKEIKNLCTARGLRFVLEGLSVEANFSDACKEIGLSPEMVSIKGGEDYCLLWTVRPEKLEEFLTQYQMKFKRKPHVLGRLEGASKKAPQVVYENQDLIESIIPFEHFTS